VAVVTAALRRGDVLLIELDPTRGSEIRKTRPCVIVSPDDLNLHLKTLLVAPLTTGAHPYPFRVACRFAGKSGHIVIDQVRSIDRERVVKRLGSLSPGTLRRVLEVLREMFAP
jgi:mRNA interferase MazF